WVQPLVDRKSGGLGFEIRSGDGSPPPRTVTRRGARCLFCGQEVPLAAVRAEGRAGRMGVRLMALVADTERQQTLFLPPSREQEAAALAVVPSFRPAEPLAYNPKNINAPPYGMETFDKLFTPRQL